MATRALTPPIRHDDDFAAWAFDQARRLREGRFSELDVANVAEELESLGRAEYSQLVSELMVLLHHLLKWRFQPERRGRSWALSIEEHRLRAQKSLRDNPSLKPRWGDAVDDAYAIARVRTARILRRDLDAFPAACPFSREEMLDRPPEDIA